MLIPTRGKYLCEIISRDKQLQSGLWIADKIKSEKKDNVARCVGVGDPAIKDCYLCHDKKICKKKCEQKGKILPLIARRTDIVHFKSVFGQRITYERKKYIFLTNDDIIAIERSGEIKAVGSMVIIRLKYAEKMNEIYIPDNAKQMSGDFWGEVISVGENFPDKDLKEGDKIYYLRAEGYRFRSFDGREDLLAVKEKWTYAKEGV